MRSHLYNNIEFHDSSGRHVNRQTFKCPYCPQANLTCDSLRGHCNQLHPNGKLKKKDN